MLLILTFYNNKTSILTIFILFIKILCDLSANQIEQRRTALYPTSESVFSNNTADTLAADDLKFDAKLKKALYFTDKQLKETHRYHYKAHTRYEWINALCYTDKVQHNQAYDKRKYYLHCLCVCEC